MAVDARKKFQDILNADLDGLLASARAKTAELRAQPATVASGVADSSAAASDATKLANAMAYQLEDSANEASISRQQKVAIVRHMIVIGDRILA